MTALINQELAKLERQDRGRSSDPALDTLAEAWKMGTQQREYNERKRAERSDDAMKIMAVTAGDYNTDYENSSIEENIKRLDIYMDQNKNKLDATAIDYYQVTKNAMEDQIKSNTDFNTMESRLLGKNKEMADFVNGLDRSDQIGTDELQQIKDMNMGWIKYTSDFQRKHGDRLNRNLYTNLRGQLGQSAKINSFLLEQARDDNWLSEDEYVAWRGAWEDLSIDPITEFNKKEDKQRDLSSKVLQGQINEVMSEYSKYQNFLSGAGTMKINDQELFLNQLMEEEKETYKQQAGTMISTMTSKLGDLDKRYMNLDNNSFVENYLPNFYKTPGGGGSGGGTAGGSGGGTTGGAGGTTILKPQVEELPLSALSNYSSWKNASMSVKDRGVDNFFGREDIVEKDTSGGGTKTVLNFDKSKVLSTYESRLTDSNIKKQLTANSGIVRELSKESGIKSQYIVDMLEPRRKELVKSKFKKDYVVDIPEKKKPTGVKIKRHNKSIRKLSKKIKYMPDGGYKAFADMVIGGWDSLTPGEKSKYNSFEDWVEKTLMKEIVTQKISM